MLHAKKMAVLLSLVIGRGLCTSLILSLKEGYSARLVPGVSRSVSSHWIPVVTYVVSDITGSTMYVKAIPPYTQLSTASCAFLCICGETLAFNVFVQMFSLGMWKPFFFTAGSR